MDNVYAIISGKGGVGKTTIAINLAYLLSKKFKVLLVDVNLSTPNVAIFLGIDPVYTLNDVLRGDVEVNQAIVKKDSLDVLPAGISFRDLIGIEPEKIKDVIESVKDNYDYIFLDTSAGIGKEAQYGIKAADMAIAVTTPEPPSLVDTLKSIKLAEKFLVPTRGVIVNMFSGKYLQSTISDFLEKEILGIIPYDPIVKVSVQREEPFVKKNTKATRALMKAAEKLTGEKFIEEKSIIDVIMSALGLKKQ